MDMPAETCLAQQHWGDASGAWPMQQPATGAAVAVAAGAELLVPANLGEASTGLELYCMTGTTPGVAGAGAELAPMAQDAAVPPSGEAAERAHVRPAPAADSPAAVSRAAIFGWTLPGVLLGCLAACASGAALAAAVDRIAVPAQLRRWCRALLRHARYAQGHARAAMVAAGQAGLPAAVQEPALSTPELRMRILHLKPGRLFAAAGGACSVQPSMCAVGRYRSMH